MGDNHSRRVRALAACGAFASVLVAGAAASAGSGVATVSRPAPPFDLETPGGGDDLTLHSFRGRPLVLNVFASWCPPCREELPRIASAAHHAKARVAFLGVDEQEAEQMATMFAKQMRLPYPIALDHGQFAASYGARSLPETVFVDAHGTVRAIVHGSISAELLARNLAEISK
jgi:cytochrome c biogenesis protein CcmG/thiol:disulfide interchange protein DsbE